MELSKAHLDNIKALKSAILQSRYRAASLINKALLKLYFAVGRFISQMRLFFQSWATETAISSSSTTRLESSDLQEITFGLSVATKSEDSFLKASFTRRRNAKKINGLVCLS